MKQLSEVLASMTFGLIIYGLFSATYHIGHRSAERYWKAEMTRRETNEASNRPWCNIRAEEVQEKMDAAEKKGCRATILISPGHYDWRYGKITTRQHKYFCCGPDALMGKFDHALQVNLTVDFGNGN